MLFEGEPAKTWILFFSGLESWVFLMGWPAKTGFLYNSRLEKKCEGGGACKNAIFGK